MSAVRSVSDSALSDQGVVHDMIFRERSGFVTVPDSRSYGFDLAISFIPLLDMTSLFMIAGMFHKICMTSRNKL